MEGTELGVKWTGRIWSLDLANLEVILRVSFFLLYFFVKVDFRE